LKVSGVSVQDLAPQLPDTRNLTPETYNVILMAHSLHQPAPLIKSTVFKEV
jgi:hypothetical protein